jgi:hypothetical protein
MLAGLIAIGCDPMAAVTNKKLEGSFSADHPDIGTWSLTPTSCESGRDHGFVGMLYRFDAGAPIQELRIDVARDGDNLIEIHYPDRDATVKRIREAECATIGGSITQQNVSLNGRPMVRLVGVSELDCPDFKLKGHAEFDGCLPPL